MPSTCASTCRWLSVTTNTRSAPSTTLAVVTTPFVDTDTPEPTRLSVRRGWPWRDIGRWAITVTTHGRARRPRCEPGLEPGVEPCVPRECSEGDHRLLALHTCRQPRGRLSAAAVEH